MVIKRLRAEGFRNYELLDTDFSEKVNIIIGDNAQGKTNLLEAVYMFTGGRSFRERSDTNIIGFGKDFARLSAWIDACGREHRLEMELVPGRRKQVTANGVKLKTLSDLSGRLTAVLFCPEDLYMVREGAAVRRHLMDACISQLRPRYAELLAEYNRLYAQKARVLKDYHERPDLLDMLDIYSERMAELSAELMYFRAHFIRRLAPAAAAIHRDFSDGLETLTLEYRTVSTVTDPLESPKTLLPQILEHQRTHRRAELESGSCLSGIHKDDLEFFINGRSAKSFASQGQMRTAALSVKLAERELHFEETGEYPVLLLDDVLSELDAKRQAFVLNRITDGQVFITCCEDAFIANRTGGRIFTVRSGELIP